jgi:hypothetical protein
VTPRVLAIGFGLIAISAAAYLLVGLGGAKPAPVVAPPSPPIAVPTVTAPPPSPPVVPPLPPPLRSEPLVAPSPGAPVLPRPEPPPPAPPEPSLQITRDEAQRLEPIVTSIKQEVAHLKQDLDLGRLGKKDAAEMLERAERDALRRLEPILGPERARQYLETLRNQP